MTAKKIKILNKLCCDMSVAWVSHEQVYHLHHLNERKKIQASAKAYAPISVKVSQEPKRNPNIEEIKTLLTVWLSEHVKKRGSVVGDVDMWEKVCSFYEHMITSEDSGSASDFWASKGWFANFTWQFNMHNVKQGQLIDDYGFFMFYVLLCFSFICVCTKKAVYPGINWRLYTATFTCPHVTHQVLSLFKVDLPKEPSPHVGWWFTVHAKFCSENLKVWDCLGDLGIGGRIMLKQIL